MVNRCIALLFWTGVLISSVHDYRVHMEFKRSSIPGKPNSKIEVNKKEMVCRCGSKPQILIFVAGDPFAYCWEHAPLRPDMEDFVKGEDGKK